MAILCAMEETEMTVTVYGVKRTFSDPISAARWVAHVKGTGKKGGRK